MVAIVVKSIGIYWPSQCSAVVSSSCGHQVNNYVFALKVLWSVAATAMAGVWPLTFSSSSALLKQGCVQ